MSVIDPALRIASVTLGVSDLPRSVDFYERVLGLGALSIGAEEALLGPEARQPALRLIAIEHPARVPRVSTGLFHVAWLHPSRAALASTVRRIIAARWRIDGASDHGVSEALYLSDPDGLGIEIYADRPREQWQRPPSGTGVEMFTLPLDVDDLLAQAGEEPTPRMAVGSTIGHVHMKVSDVARANSFYRDGLGFEEQAEIPAAAFLSAGGYHHHVGLNSWQSEGAARAPAEAPGLRLIEFQLSGAGALEAVERTLADAGGAAGGAAGPAAGSARDQDGRLTLRDPDGQPLRFRAASG
jgi:catechol 2,3-dioxygenase